MNISFDKQILIIIGLPGSGKTFFSKNIEKKGYIIFDDFITSFYDGQIISCLKRNLKICLNDPRLCLKNIFDYYINKILKIVDKSNIYLILFENNSERCLKNINNRNDNRKRVEETVVMYSNQYDVCNYKNFEHCLIDVYQE